MFFDTVTIVTLTIGISFSIIGLIVFLTNKKSPTNKRFIAFVFAISSWLVTNYLSGNPNEPHQVSLWANRIVLIVGGLSIALLLDFVALLSGLPKYHRRLMAVIYVVNLISWIFCLTPIVVKDVYVDSGHVINDFGGAEMIYFIPLFLTAIILCVVLIVARIKAEDIVKRQLRLLSNSIIFAVIIIIIGNAVMPILGNYAIVNYTPLSVSFIVVAMIYSMVNHQLFDVKQATMRTVGYVLTIATMAGIYIALAYAVSLIFFRGQVVDGVSFSPMNIALALVMAFVFQPIKRFFDKVTNRIFYRDEYNRDVFFMEFGKILSHDTDLKLLLREASHYLSTNMKAEYALFYILDRGIYGNGQAKNVSLRRKDINVLTKYAQAKSLGAQAISDDLIEDSDVKRILNENKIKIFMPLIVQKEVFGYLFLGEHKSRGYSRRDLTVLSSIANELSIAIQNSLSVEEIRELNATLQQSIDEATDELRTKNRQLQRLDEVKDEFLSIASHQLRTPLTSIKGYVDMMLEGDFGDIPGKQREVLEDIFTSSERMVQLINDFLNVSRIQTGKFALERRPTDLEELIEKEIKLMSASLEQRNLKIDWQCDEMMPLLNVDTDKIRQVVVNMIDNAIYYSRPDTTIKVRLDKEPNNLVFTVIDTGIGVPKKEQANLFGKFFRASNARKRRPDGTGVGLYLAKKIVDTHGGEIIFESVEGEGSTFGFKLPLVA